MSIKVYTADVSALENEALFMSLYNGVSAERRAKTDRMVFGKDKRLSLGAGALLEAALAAEGVTDLTFTTELCVVLKKLPIRKHIGNEVFI